METITDKKQVYTLDDHSFREQDQYALTKYEITLRWLRDSFGEIHGKNLKLFNIGCGAGEFNRQAYLEGFRVTGLEPDQDTFKMSVQNNMTTPAVELRNTGVFDPTLLGTNPDVIVMHDVLEHIEDHVGAVKQLAAILNGKGRLIISVPALQSLFGYHDDLLKHYRRYTIQSLEAVLEPYFVIKRKRYFGMFFIPLVYWFSVKTRKPYPTAQASRGFGAFVLGLICKIESRLPLPIGTSVLMELLPRKC